ncbi:MAG TPA: TIR domain-containing protein [Syntrophorhabdus sp.]|nr:TIR domain-containing protein [Syntrophorhabdus sp.]
MSEENPRLFISYSWTSPEYEEWVLELATELCENGVDVIIDKWNLKEGHDANAFMEKMASDPSIKKVAIVCDKVYAEKADGRSGGVGTETQIISPEVYAREDQDKFVAVVTEKDDRGKPFLPVYYKSRIYIDLSDSDLYAKNFEQLLRWIYDKPLYVKPELGKKPVFLEDSQTVTLGTSSKAKRVLDAIRNNKDYCRGALNEYFEVFTVHLERFRIMESEGEFDDRVIENIEQFSPFRNEAIEILLSLAQYRDTPETMEQIHRFFEGLIPFMFRPNSITRWRESDFDNFRFIIHELFLYAVASYLKYERYDAVAHLLRHDFYFEKNEEPRMVSFSILRQHMRSLGDRNKRLSLRRLSLRADLLMQRAKGSGLGERQLMQADFVLFMCGSLNGLRYEALGWYPETLFYAHNRAFEIFARAQSRGYFEKLKCLFDIDKKEDLEPLMKAFENGSVRVPTREFDSFSPAALLGYDQLATKP